MKNKYLILVFLVLLLVYLGITLLGNQKEESFSDTITDFSVETVDQLRITPKGQGKKSFELIKKDGSWSIISDDKSYEADMSAVENALSAMHHIKVDNIVAKKPEKWAKYELGDGQCTRVEVFSNGKKHTDLLIGKMKFNPQARTANSYVRLHGKNEVFATEGFSGFMVSDNADSYRDKTLARFDPKDLKSIRLTNGDQAVTLTPQDGNWVASGLTTDSSKITAYINALSRLRGQKLVDPGATWKAPAPAAQLQLSLGDKTIDIMAYPDTTVAKAFILHSSDNEKAYFDSDSSGLYKRVFGDLVDMVR